METQVQNDSCQVSICSLDSEVHEYLKNNFNKHLNDKVYTMFEGLFGSINVHSIKERLYQKSTFVIILQPGSWNTLAQNMGLHLPLHI